MSNTWFSSDLHIGHRNIGKFRDGINSDAENRAWIEDFWWKNIKKRDTVILLGDSAFSEDAIDWLARLPGTKINYGGNHDDEKIESYLRAFSKVRGCESKSKVGWLSHFPLHPAELRGKFSIHGHVHYQTIDDWRYINVCCDNLQRELGQPFIDINHLRRIIEKRKEKQKVVYCR